MTTKKFITVVLPIAMTVPLFSFDLPTGWFKAGDKSGSHNIGIDLPTGWFKAGGKPDSYDMGIDKGAGKKMVKSQRP